MDMPQVLGFHVAAELEGATDRGKVHVASAWWVRRGRVRLGACRPGSISLKKN